MPEVLAILEAKDSATLRTACLHVVTFARQVANAINGTFAIALVGHQLERVAESARMLGAAQVYVIDAPWLAVPLPENGLPSLQSLIELCGARFVIGGATSTGKDLLPRLAQALHAAYVNDCIGISGSASRLLWLRYVCAGNAIAHCEAYSPITVASVRYSQFEPAAPVAELSPLVSVPATAGLSIASQVEYLSFEAVENPRPELGEARVVVSGGRALANKFFELLAPLADHLGAALGATRAACDAGFAPSDFQVGQTGKVVCPDLYFAIGISGAIQHLAGMRGSKVIVAVNSDPKAPIVSVADYALVGDLFSIVPEIIAALGQQPVSS